MSVTGLCGQAGWLLQSASLSSSRGLLRRCQPCTAAFLTAKRHKGELTAYKRGRGGRSSFNGIVATVFGCSGFLGRYVVNQLGKMGTQVVVAYRGTEYDSDHLRICGDLGQILFSHYNLKEEDTIRNAMKHSNVVINLVGRDWETKNYTYDEVHVDGARRIARIAAETGVQKLIHVSAMNADNPQRTAFGKISQFVASKGRGEIAVREEFPDVTIMRPADMYGDEDRFISYWAKHWRKHFEVMPVWKGGAQTIKQPVDVVNVAQGIVKAMIDPQTDGKVIDCIGTDSYYLRDMIQFFYDEMRYGHIVLIPLLPTFLAKVAICGKIFPATPPLHLDKLYKEAASDVPTGDLTLADLGIQLTPFEDGARYQLKIHRQSRDYQESLHEIANAPPPPTVAAIAESKRNYY